MNKTKYILNKLLVYIESIIFTVLFCLLLTCLSGIWMISFAKMDLDFDYVV